MWISFIFLYTDALSGQGKHNIEYSFCLQVLSSHKYANCLHVPICLHAHTQAHIVLQVTDQSCPLMFLYKGTIHTNGTI